MPLNTFATPPKRSWVEKRWIEDEVRYENYVKHESVLISKPCLCQNKTKINNSRFICSNTAVLFNGSFRAALFSFADLRGNKGF